MFWIRIWIHKDKSSNIFQLHFECIHIYCQQTHAKHREFTHTSTRAVQRTHSHTSLNFIYVRTTTAYESQRQKQVAKQKQQNRLQKLQRANIAVDVAVALVLLLHLAQRWRCCCRRRETDKSTKGNQKVHTEVSVEETNLHIHVC